jgi:hypothetical protein
MLGYPNGSCTHVHGAYGHELHNMRAHVDIDTGIGGLRFPSVLRHYCSGQDISRGTLVFKRSYDYYNFH